MSNDYERLIRNELDYWPGVTVAFSHTAKHRRATFTYKDQSRFVIYPDTPGDTRRGPLNNIANVRAELSALGAERLPRKPSKRKRAGKVVGTRKPTKPRVPKITPPEPAVESWRSKRRAAANGDVADRLLAMAWSEPLDLGQFPQPTLWDNLDGWGAKAVMVAAAVFAVILILIEILP